MNTFFAVWNLFIKLANILPIIVFYLISKRLKRYDKQNEKIFLISLVFAVSNFIFIFLLNFFLNSSVAKTVDYITFLQIQTIGNVSLLISFLFLYIGVTNLRKRPDNKFLYRVVLMILLICICTITGQDFYLRLNILTYVLSVYFLINSFISMSYLIRGFKIKEHFFFFLASVFLLISLLLYIKSYFAFSSFYPDVSILLYMRTYIYISKALSGILSLIPLSIFLRKANSKNLHVRPAKNIDIIKDLLYELENIYGDIANEVFRDVCKKYGKSISSIKNKKKFIRELIATFSRVFSEDIVMQIVRRNPKLYKYVDDYIFD